MKKYEVQISFLEIIEAIDEDEAIEKAIEHIEGQHVDIVQICVSDTRDE